MPRIFFQEKKQKFIYLQYVSSCPHPHQEMNLHLSPLYIKRYLHASVFVLQLYTPSLGKTKGRRRLGAEVPGLTYHNVSIFTKKNTGFIKCPFSFYS